MNPYARKDTAMLVRRSFSLDTERDAALIAWLDQKDNVSEAIRAALRDHCGSPQITLADVCCAIGRLSERLDSLNSNAAPIRAETTHESPELAANLDRLGL